MTRTSCACPACVACCQRQPGYLIPGDLERIAAARGEAVTDVSRLFRSSPGALVQDTRTGRQFRVRTIVPAYDRRRKACVFLDAADRCTIHAVAPFGCAFFDPHMPPAEAQPRSVWGIRQIQASDTYRQQREALDVADHYKPLGY